MTTVCNVTFECLEECVLTILFLMYTDLVWSRTVKQRVREREKKGESNKAKECQ